MSQNHFNMPSEAVEFLKAGRQFNYDPNECEPGEVNLKRLDELRLGEVWIHARMRDDPNYGKDGYYAVPAVSLTGECKDYDPEFILLWLPEERLFGTWDCDHWILTVFDNANWSDILARPAEFLNVQWFPSPDLGTEFLPWMRYSLKPGRPF